MEIENLDLVYDFYNDFNNKNKDTSIERKELIDFKEDVIETINYDLKRLNDILGKIEKLDMTKPLNEINYSYTFRDILTDFNSTLLDLSSEFSDFHEFNVKFCAQLPKGPKDDSELI